MPSMSWVPSLSLHSLRRAALPAIALGIVALQPVIAVPLARAQDDKMTPIAIPAQPDAIPLKTGPLPGAKNKESWQMQ